MRDQGALGSNHQLVGWILAIIPSEFPWQPLASAAQSSPLTPNRNETATRTMPTDCTGQRLPCPKRVCFPLLALLLALALLNSLTPAFWLSEPSGGAAQPTAHREPNPFWRSLAPQDATSSRQSAGRELRIPRVVHQTYPVLDLPSELAALTESWRETNPGWEVRLYDNRACLELVQNDFPEYLDAYLSLPKAVERADFFRYLVVLRFGGVYADVDTECVESLESVIRPGDRLVTGLEGEFATGEEAFGRHFVRRRQVLQWVFAGEAGHPALREACDFVAANARRRFSDSDNRDTLERTGPGMFTDIVLKHAQNAWEGVRVLPRVVFGVHPSGTDGLGADSKGIVVLHHFSGTWKKSWGWGFPGNLVQRNLNTLMGWKSSVDASSLVDDKQDVEGLFPVAIPWDCPFVVMVYQKGHGDSEARWDVGADLSMWGNWQGGMEPTRYPRVLDALVGSLRMDESLMLMDVGAGLGFFSIAAAASGHRVVAFETLPKSLEALRASVNYGNVSDLVEVHNVLLGDGETTPGCVAHSLQGSDGSDRDVHKISGNTLHKTMPATHGIPRNCNQSMLDNYSPTSGRVGAVRIAASGYAGWIVQGGLKLVSNHLPNVILIEFDPNAMRAAGDSNPEQMLWRLQELGYNEIYHAGHMCDSRWLQITKSVRHRGFFSEIRAPYLKQPTWCRLAPGYFRWLVEEIPKDLPENIMFVRHDALAESAKDAGSHIE